MNFTASQGRRKATLAIGHLMAGLTVEEVAERMKLPVDLIGDLSERGPLAIKAYVKGAGSDPRWDVAAGIELLKGGATPTQVAARFGVGVSIVSRVGTQAGIRFRKRRSDVGAKRTPAFDHAAALAELAEGDSVASVAVRHGVNQSSISRLRSAAAGNC